MGRTEFTEGRSRLVASVARRRQRDVFETFAHDGADEDRGHVVQERHLDKGDPRRLDEALFQEQVLRRIAHQGELGRQYQIGAGRGGLGAEPTEGFDVLRESAHDRVHLGHGESDHRHGREPTGAGPWKPWRTFTRG